MTELTSFFLRVALTFSIGISVFAQNAPLERTIIDSDRVVLEGGAEQNVFRFLGNVTITGTNLKARCDEMELIALRKKSSGEDDGLIGQIGGIKSLIAKGNVRIEQEGRLVEGGLAKIFPKEGYLEVSDNPRFVDSSGAVVTGKSIKLERGKRQAIVEPADDGTRARVILPPMEDLGVDLDKIIDPEAPSEEEEPATNP
ncbi:MAG: LptA/OstA family protein [Opitutales bacterium]